MASPFHDKYEPLDVIGNGFFCIIRKVRKADGPGLVRAIGGTFLFPGLRLFLADIRAQGTQLWEDERAR